jgi:hypothetical protein
MKKLILGFGLILLISSFSLAQRTNASGRGQGTAAELAGGTLIEANLQQSIDFKTVKLGDELTFLTTKDVRQGDAILVPKGATIVGRALNLKDKSLEVIFERVRAPKVDLPLNASIVSIVISTPARIPSASVKSLTSPVKGLTVSTSADPMAMGTNILTAAAPGFVLAKGVIFNLKVNGAPAK